MGSAPTHHPLTLIWVDVETRASRGEANLFVLVIFLSAVTLSGWGNNLGEGVHCDGEGTAVAKVSPRQQEGA